MYKMNNLENNIRILLNLFNAGKFETVISKSKTLIRKFPEYVILYNILGSAYQNSGDLNLAEDIFIKGHKLDSNNIAVMNNLGNVYKNNGKLKLSEELFQKIIEKDSNYINAYINLGNLKRDNNDFESAINLYSKALKINNNNPVTLYSLALAHQGLGNFNEAIDFAKKALLIDKTFTQADMLISQSTKYTADNNHYKEMTLKVKNLELSDVQKINLFFAIAKANEDMGQFEKSFNNLHQGNYIKRKSLKFNIDEEIKFFKQLKNCFDSIKSDKPQKVSVHKKKIIFILGMPRSGTSLIEQIITSHSNVFGAGELSELSKIFENNFIINKDISSEKLDLLVNDENFVTQLSNQYHNHLKRFATEKDFITDKAPLNFRWIGLIKILFPTAKIIHCSRNPKDNCLSLYKNYFEAGLNFSYDQTELGTYYKLYLDLMNFWKNYAPGLIYDAQYEKIINNSEEEIKEIIKFCELPWEDNCLSFYKNKTPIKTMSTAQARKPIYKSSINSFDKFAPFLKELNKII
jgi:tetratricopeptide (TPR) repeat protein